MRINESHVSSIALTEHEEGHPHLHLLLDVVVIGHLKKTINHILRDKTELITAHLALVLARVLHARVADLERPDVVAGVVQRREARVPRVADLADREDAQVAAPDPRHLQEREGGNSLLAPVSRKCNTICSQAAEQYKAEKSPRGPHCAIGNSQLELIN